jgi:hypothetical protein
MPAFVKEKEIDWPVVAQEKGDPTSKAYKVQGYPTTVLIDASGKIVDFYLGAHPDQETIEKYLKDVKKDEKKESK